jgi:pilus assembly protein FimV
MAGEMYTSLGTSDPVWAKVAEIGRKLEPDNPLYAASDVPETEAFAITNSGLSAADFSPVDTVDQPSLDFSVDADAPLEDQDIGSDTEAVATEGEVESALDFDLGLGEDELSQEELGKQDELSKTVSFETAGTAESDTELDFQLDMDISEQPDEVAVSSVDDIDLDLDASLNGTTVQFDLDEKHSANTVDFDIPDFDKTMPSLEVTELEVTEQLQDAPELSSNVADTEVEEFNATFESAVPEISFDLPDSSPAEENTEIEQPDFDKTVIIKSKTTAEDIVFDAAPEDASELDLSFDIDLGALDEPVAKPSDIAISAPEVDLSGISFDLDEKPAEPETLEGVPELDMDTPVADATTAESSEAESSEVDTKLDLVTAYIDMGDNEGAKELLDEVMKEGGPQQRLRANDILKSIA